MATDKQVDKRLQKTYGITLAEYEAQLELQDNGCGICRRPPSDKRLHVDHSHAVHKVKVVSERSGKGWSATAMYKEVIFYAWGRVKAQAVQEVRQKLKRASVRGLLCWRCNTGLQKWADSPELLENAAQYLRNFEEAV